ncbi:hypothetical protein [Algoriphagus halophilus]|uniref:hypothetical protein n=1 Tax=Algoriphagus halophilus TaxID=226505 RepID=UPI0011613D4A|nr:hypothetical protein [Algoriphagus halophilus]
MILPFFEKEPDWDKFHHYYFTDGREVFEVSLEGNSLYFPKEKSKPKKTAELKYFQNILFVKHQTEDRFDPLIIRYYPEEIESNRKFEEVNYQMIDEKWNGWIDLFSYDEHYLVGYKIDRGQVTHTRTMQKGMENGKKSFGYENKDVVYRCYEVATDWYDGRTGEYLDTTHSTTCDFVEDGNTTGGGAPVGGTYSGGSSGSGYYPPEVPAPKLTIYIDSSIRNDPRISCILDKFSLGSFVKDIAEITETEDLNTNSILKLESLPLDRNGQTVKRNGQYVISINSNYLDRPDLLIARTFLHELVHAEIMATLEANGITPLDANFAQNFNNSVSVLYGTTNLSGNQHHTYMAEQLLFEMGTELMNIHKTYFVEDFEKLIQEANSQGAYPKGIPVDFYMNLFWDGLKNTHAFDIMKSIETNYPILSPYEKYIRDSDLSMNLDKPCGN